MNCKEAMKCVRPYLDRTLEPRQEEEFLEHIRGCRECYEELELTFTLEHSGQQEEDLSIADMRGALEDDMERREDGVKMFYRLMTGRYALATLAFWSVVIALAVQFRIWITL